MSSEPCQPRLSSTVLLIRDRGELEVLLLARHSGLDFAAGALVFPGGKTNAEDGEEAWADYVDGDFDDAHTVVRISAVRETFEESGLLMARHRSERGLKAGLVGADIAQGLAPFRAAVDQRTQSFLDLIRDQDLVLALDQLIHFGHWITPEKMPRRFDTHFFLAMAPDIQIASHDGRETTDTLWLNPGKALQMETEGKATIIFPTRMNLVKLSFAQSCSHANALFHQAQVVTVLPQVGKTQAGEPCLYIPEAAGYGQTVELLSKVSV